MDSFKGTVSRDFLLLVFLMNQFPPQPQSFALGPFRFFAGGKFATGVNDTGGKIGAGINDTGGKFATGVSDAGVKFFHQFR